VKIKVLPSAISDLDRGRMFYARQGTSVGDYFLDSLFSDIDSLELYAGVHMKVFDFHRMLARRFPYAVYYRIDGDGALYSVFLIAGRNRKKQQRL
jgi:hypothetical protein